jgi:hypothetical protein
MRQQRASHAAACAMAVLFVMRQNPPMKVKSSLLMMIDFVPCNASLAATPVRT